MARRLESGAAIAARDPRRRRRSAPRRLARALLVLGVGVLLFVLGLAVGRATREHPAPGARTEVRTLVPGTVAPPPRTVTTTVTVAGDG